MLRRFLALALAVAFSITWVAAQQSVGLFLDTDEAFEGYTLWAPLNHEITYLINNEGRLIHTWPSLLNPGFTAYLRDNGDIVRAAAGRPPTGGPGSRRNLSTPMRHSLV
jgi:hypothetical protein